MDKSFESNNRTNLTRSLIQVSAKKADRMEFADQDDHNLNSS